MIDRQSFPVSHFDIHLKTVWREHNWALCSGHSGHRQLRSCSYNCTAWHTYPTNFREGSTLHAVINQCLKQRQVNGEREQMKREREESKLKRWDRELGRGRGREEVAKFCAPNHIRLLPNPFLSLPLFSCWNVFILGLFLLCELLTHHMMDH